MQRGDVEVFCLWGRGPFDKALAEILAQLAKRNGFRARLDAAWESSEVTGFAGSELRITCFSSLLIGRSSAQLRQYMKRLRRLAANSKILLCLWGREIGELRSTDSGIDLDFDFYASSFKEAISWLLSARLAFDEHPVAGADAA
jgi:hypothetical protein